MSGSFSPVFSSRNFTVLGLMFVFNLFWVNFCLTLRFENHSLLAYLLINLWMPPFPPPLTHIPFVLPDLTKGHLFRETFDQDFRNLGSLRTTRIVQLCQASTAGWALWHGTLIRPLWCRLSPQPCRMRLDSGGFNHMCVTHRGQMLFY